jgi:hypothetical protein
MSVNLDGYNLFDEPVTIEAQSNRREATERSVAGLDGTISIDLGGRGRKIRQKGSLRARSKTELDDRIAVISAFIDGRTHALANSNAETFENLRIDSINVKDEKASGAGVTTDYEIVYMQLTV